MNEIAIMRAVRPSLDSSSGLMKLPIEVEFNKYAEGPKEELDMYTLGSKMQREARFEILLQILLYTKEIESRENHNSKRPYFFAVAQAEMAKVWSDCCGFQIIDRVTDSSGDEWQYIGVSTGDMIQSLSRWLEEDPSNRKIEGSQMRIAQVKKILKFSDSQKTIENWEMGVAPFIHCAALGYRDFQDVDTTKVKLSLHDLNSISEVESLDQFNDRAAVVLSVGFQSKRLGIENEVIQFQIPKSVFNLKGQNWSYAKDDWVMNFSRGKLKIVRGERKIPNQIKVVEIEFDQKLKFPILAILSGNLPRSEESFKIISPSYLYQRLEKNSFSSKLISTIQALAFRGDGSLSFSRNGESISEHSIGMEFLGNLERVRCSFGQGLAQCNMGERFYFKIPLDSLGNIIPSEIAVDVKN